MLGASGCEDLVQAGRAAIAPEPADSVPPATASEPSAPSPEAPRGRRVPREPAELLGTPAWEGERSAVAEELQAIFADERVTGAIVVHDLRSGATLRSDPERAARRTTPASTFKIVHALIALETGVVASPFDTLRWDGREREVSAWNRDHDLSSAFRASAVWYFEDVARRIGTERMETWLRRVGYGNGAVQGGSEPFWLGGPLRISPDEQIGFLRRLRTGELPFSSRSMQTVRELMVLDSGDGWAMHGKTGWSRGADADIVWLVGWVDRGEDTAIFAIEFENEARARDVVALRERIYRRILTELGLVPARR